MIQPEAPPCVCGHPAEAHEHYRAGTDCGACGATTCPAYRVRADKPATATDRSTPVGSHANIAGDRFPKQGRHLHARVEVRFHYDLSQTIGGVVVRDDVEEPHRTIISLDDGRVVLGTECQYSVAPQTGVDRG